MYQRRLFSFAVHLKDAAKNAKQILLFDKKNEFQEKLTLIEACLKTNQLHRAQILFRSLQQNDPELFKMNMDIHKYNSFMNSLLSLPKSNSPLDELNFKNIFQWFNKIKQQPPLRPNQTSFELMIQAALKYLPQEQTSSKSYLNARQMIQMFIQDWKSAHNGKTEIDFLKSAQYLETSEIESIKKILNIKLTEVLTENSPTILKEMDRFVLPEIMSSRSTNLSTLQQNLSPLYKIGELLHSNDNTHTFQTLFDLQTQIEQQSFTLNMEQIMSIDQKKKDIVGIGILPKEIKIMAKQWHQSFSVLLAQEIATLKNNPKENEQIIPFLLLFEKNLEKLSIAVLSQFLKSFSLGTDKVLSSKLVSDIGEAVQQEYKMMVLKSPKIKQQLMKSYLKNSKPTSARQLEQGFKKVKETELSKTDFNFTEWSSETKMKLGSILALNFIKVAIIPVENGNCQFAFAHGYSIKNGKSFGVFKPHESIYKSLNSSATDLIGNKTSNGIFMPNLLPMILPPKPWEDYKTGGYLTIKTDCIRGLNKEMEFYLNTACATGKMDDVLEALSILGQTPWIINTRLLKVILEAWNKNMSIADLPKDYGSLKDNLPEIPDKFENERERAEFFRNYYKKKQEYYDAYGLRASENYKLEIARAFSGKVFYFPHSLDFRGRAYPIPQLFSHIGNDLSRSLLLFANGKPLGSKGLQWLKIHLANCYGFDKASFEERISFVDQKIEDIRQAVAEPLNEKSFDWWLKADKPWITLATSMELISALDSGDPESFVCHLPIHQDGSCNGLQHYSALGGDIMGAKQVNLACGDRPEDVYKAVAMLVKKEIENDLAQQPEKPLTDWPSISSIKDLNDPAIRHFLAQKFLPERMDRKMVKQTVMTSVYGVTFVGARAQVANRLKEKYSDQYDERQMKLLSLYLTPKIFSALDNMFSGAREIQTWLHNTAKEIARSVPGKELEKGENLKEKVKQMKIIPKSGQLTSVPLNCRSTVIWTTPLGLPVVQPYKRMKTKSVSTALQTFTISQSLAESPVDVMKQSAAFPPNFIHSLDATHMMMTALACSKLDDPITFASVHDSYWTHACDIERLREVLKEQFIELHSRDIMKELREEFIRQTADRKVLNVYNREDLQRKIQKLNSEQNWGNFVLDKKKSRLLLQYDDQENQTVQESSSEVDALSLPKKQKLIKIWESIEIPELPKKGAFDVQQVRQSKYFFS